MTETSGGCRRHTLTLEVTSTSLAEAGPDPIRMNLSEGPCSAEPSSSGWVLDTCNSCLEEEYTLQLDDPDQPVVLFGPSINDRCTLPSTVTITPVAHDRDDQEYLDKTCCIPTMQPGVNVPGTPRNPFSIPYLAPTTPDVFAFVADATIPKSADALQNVFRTAHQLRDAVIRSMTRLTARSGFGEDGSGPAAINPANGNVAFQFEVPAPGPLSPRVVLTYNVVKRKASMIGHGWTTNFSGFVIRLAGSGDDSNVVLTTGEGAEWIYWALDASANSKFYRPVGGVMHSLRVPTGSARRWVETWPNGMECFYLDDQDPEAKGRLQCLQNPSGARWTVNYEDTMPPIVRRIQFIEDPGNQRTTFAYTDGTGDGTLDEIKDAYGRTTQFTVTSGDLVQITTAAGETTEFKYDSDHRMTAIIDADGHRTSYSYDSLDWVTEIRGPNNKRLTYTWFDDEATLKDAQNYVTTFAFNPGRNITRIIDLNEDVVSYSWCGHQLTGLKDSFGAVYTLNYTRLRDVTSDKGSRLDTLSVISCPNGSVTFLYDIFEGPTAGTTTLFIDRLEAVEDQTGARASLSWDTGGNRLATIDWNGKSVDNTYTSLGRIATVEDALGNRTSISYNTLGEVTEVENPLGNKTTFAYDKGRISDFSTPEGNLTEFTYDSAYRLTGATRGGHTETIEYDACGRPNVHIDPLGNRSTTVYDKVGLPVRAVDALNHTTTTAYDTLGRPTKRTTPVGSEWTTVYQDSLSKVLRIDARGSQTIYTYEGAQLLRWQYPGGVRVTFEYDDCANLTRIEDSTGIYSFVYDEANRLRSSVSPLGGVGYERDRVGNLAEVTDPDGGFFTYTYDDAGRLEVIENPQEGRTTWLYDDAGRRTEKLLASGVRVSYIYDKDGQITHIRDRRTFPRQRISKFDYTYDARGNRVVLEEKPVSGSHVTWTYDSASQLQKENLWNTIANGTVTYDAVGNILNRVIGVHRITYTYDDDNRLRTSDHDTLGVTTFSYDANGNQTLVEEPDGDRATSTWDLENQRTLLELPNGTVVTSAFNALGRRIKEEY